MTRTGKLKLSIFVLLVGYVVFSALFATSFSQGPNNRNVSVDTRVNITDSFPEIQNVFVDQNITLNAGGTTTVFCNVSAFDYNGGSTITANATFFFASSGLNDPDDNNSHYTNSSCAVAGTDGIYRNFTCSFGVQYYANSSAWNCTVNVTDDNNFTTQGSNSTTIEQLLALNVTTLIDFGDLAVGDTSSAEEANITNLGNVDINVTVEGYGATISDGLAMDCQVGNIGVQYEKFNLVGGVNPALYTNLSSSPQQVSGLTINHQQNDSQQEINTTFWLLVVPPNPFGLCNGTVIFEAQSSI